MNAGIEKENELETMKTNAGKPKKQTAKVISLKDYCYFPSFVQALEELKNMAMSESWDYRDNPQGNNPVLFSYIQNTFLRVMEEGKVQEEDGYSIFNTGLVTRFQEPIFCLMETNSVKSSKWAWKFAGWKKESDRELVEMGKLPEHASYLTNITDLIMDTTLPLRVDYEHIIEDNIDRFPEVLRDNNREQLAMQVKGAISVALQRVSRNYRVAVPQYFHGEIQLLLPLCLQGNEAADVVLVLEKKKGFYRASSCLTMAMAMNNARLIARLDNEWM